jgi:prepilin-type N-terminal cleavage/methylation domain-containing protein
MGSANGFSLLELLLVVVMITILSAVAVPNMLAARRAANEASAIATLKNFVEANHSYYATNYTFGTPGQLYSAGFVDEQLGTPFDKCGKTIFIKHGYAFTMVPTKLERLINSGKGSESTNERIIITEYYMDAMPESSYAPTLARTGVRWFYIDSISNIPWIIKKSLETDGGGSPCSPGVVCYDLSKSKPRYDVCIPLN